MDYLTAHIFVTTEEAGGKPKNTIKALDARVAIHAFFVAHYQYVYDMWVRAIDKLKSTN